ncbi:PREDICTED: uncharacterized protein LOC109213163 [Nicotiana attenuata]|uniref:uncharacterized protein LOC109213163 n=1 Tax=Nicotiana attenuata TaxID=49451 RepID=UPI000904AFAF|nr:PREDICTED: uncharacterized protein LOC109213163 [Nicotiana attenuata]
MWKTNIAVNVVQVHEQCIHCVVSDTLTGYHIMLTVVYARNKQHERTRLWYELQMMGNQVQIPWLISGDFNSVLKTEDRMGQPVTMNEIKEFKHCIDSIQLTPLNTKGCFYTWCNKQYADDRVYSRIDWAFGNFEWIKKYGHVDVVGLEPGVSDHSPIVIQIWKTKNIYPKPFKLYMKLKTVTKGLNKEMTSYEKRLNHIRQQLEHVQNNLKISPLNQEMIEKEKQQQELIQEVTHEEVDAAVKDMPNDRAPVYKIIAKIMTKRIKKVIECLIGKAQSAFIEGGSIVDNVLFSHELFNGYNRKGLSPRCILKEDLKKAYDSLDWKLLIYMLTDLGFPQKFIGWIMECVTTYLQREMSTLAVQKEFRYHPKCKKLGVTHICFANDLLMFCRGDKQSVNALQNTLNKFSNASGLQASAEKSSIYIAGRAVYPIKYLGVPLSARKLNIHQCLPLVEKITERVRCWSARMLSYSGRVQLIKSVLFGVQTYWAQIFLIPKKNMKMIETVCRTFLSTGSNEFSRKTLLAWDKICQPKSAGGLNVINMRI